MRPAVYMPPLSVVVQFAGDPPAGMGGFQRKIIYPLALQAIRKYQEYRYPGGQDLDAVHSMLALKDGMAAGIMNARVLDITYPLALIHEFEFNPKHRYHVYLPEVARACEDLRRGDRHDQGIWIKVMDAVERESYEIHGTKYDDLQLLGIGFQPIFASILKRHLPPPFGEKIGEALSHKLLLGWGKTRHVCSTGTHTVLVVAYKVLKENGIKCTRPLGDSWVEETPPAGFANDPTATRWDV